MEFRTTSTKPSRRSAFSLVELLVAIGLAGLLVTAIASFVLYSARSFAAMFNYADMEQKSQVAIDTLSRDIRQTAAVTHYTTNELVFRDYDDKLLTFSWTPESRALVRVKEGVTKVLLTECNYLRFDVWQRTPIQNTWSNHPTAIVTNAKIVNVSWTCSRKILGAELTTESVQTSKIVIRN
jgi:molybdopterin biosynthesis enzyme